MSKGFRAAKSRAAGFPPGFFQDGNPAFFVFRDFTQLVPVEVPRQIVCGLNSGK